MFADVNARHFASQKTALIIHGLDCHASALGRTCKNDVALVLLTESKFQNVKFEADMTLCHIESIPTVNI